MLGQSFYFCNNTNQTSKSDLNKSKHSKESVQIASLKGLQFESSAQVFPLRESKQIQKQNKSPQHTKGISNIRSESQNQRIVEP